ncbi:hypothetical protein [Pectobacterium brasiliense]|uniref:hypothetical protein n=1 Tax=Pectobacterium brasiliense TaxID=180957 RepID=UPI00057F6994|nr:hypothetical protein [Pectobacterium brasiliense]KHS90530.1 hypothetical protein RC83_01370 [Pectobacterium brasiliense]
MSYARRAVIKRTPAMQAALDKRAAMMLRVHEARVSGEMADATTDTVRGVNRLVQDIVSLVIKTNTLPSKYSAPSQVTTLNPIAEHWMKSREFQTFDLKMPATAEICHNIEITTPFMASPHVAAVLMGANCYQQQLMTNESDANEPYTSCGYQYTENDDVNQKLAVMKSTNSEHIYEDNDETPCPLSGSTYPPTYFGPKTSR